MIKLKDVKPLFKIMAKKKFFISTAIDYPSEKPHLGHCLEKIQADVIARYRRIQGFNVHFSTGTDEHGLKIQRRAERSGKKPKEFVDEMSQYFKDAWGLLNVSNDDFIRTTEKRHIKVVQEIIKKIYGKGDIYKGKYKGLYCVDCETYYMPKDLIDGKCPIHQKLAELIEEKGYFFRMNKYQEALIRHIKENKNFIIPDSKRNEILNRLKEPLQDLSISRAKVGWGIPFPFDKNLSLFVWIDALINYLSTIDYPRNKFKKFWPADVHIIGKDIVWHHSVIWGSLLLSLGLSLPKTIFVHGFITVNGQKMSKSLGNIIDPFELVKKYGTDAVRYFLLRESSPFDDLDFTFEKFEKRYNSDLADGLGNLVARIITLAKKSKIKNQSTKQKVLCSAEPINMGSGQKSKIQIKNQKFKKGIGKTWKNYKKTLDEFKFNEALISIWELISFCNHYIEKEKPWELIKSKVKSQKSKVVISNLLLALKEIAKLLQPFLPQTSEKIGEQIKTKKTKPLFPRIK